MLGTFKPRLLPVSPEITSKFLESPFFNRDHEAIAKDLDNLLRTRRRSTYNMCQEFTKILNVKDKASSNFSAGYSIGFKVLDLQAGGTNNATKIPIADVTVANDYFKELKTTGYDADSFLWEHEDTVQRTDPAFYDVLDEFAYKAAREQIIEQNQIKLGGIAIYCFMSDQLRAAEVSALNKLFKI